MRERITREGIAAFLREAADRVEGGLPIGVAIVATDGKEHVKERVYIDEITGDGGEAMRQCLLRLAIILCQTLETGAERRLPTIPAGGGN